MVQSVLYTAQRNRKAVYPGVIWVTVRLPAMSTLGLRYWLLIACNLTEVVVYRIPYTMVWHSGIGILLHVCLYGVVCLLPQLPHITTSL